jgi:hypothetical protein
MKYHHVCLQSLPSSPPSSPSTKLPFLHAASLTFTTHPSPKQQSVKPAANATAALHPRPGANRQPLFPKQSSAVRPQRAPRHARGVLILHLRNSRLPGTSIPAGLIASVTRATRSQPTAPALSRDSSINICSFLHPRYVVRQRLGLRLRIHFSD